MSARVRWMRVLIGFLAVCLLLGVAFSLIIPWIHTWGATEEELARDYPGDELIEGAQIEWLHGLTIHASPQTVWPWIAQIGEERGGYYSYTFIENAIAGKNLYQNADHIIAELQDPQPGEKLIGGGMMHVKEVKTGEWMLGMTNIDEIGWTWLWYIYPMENGDTRLMVRMEIKAPDGYNNPVMVGFLDLGSYVMERRMMVGIKEHAEGRIPSANIEGVEIAIWLFTLLPGLFAAWLFISRKRWIEPMIAGLLCVLALLVLTFLQPAIWLRIIIEVILLLAVVYAARVTGKVEEKTNI